MTAKAMRPRITSHLKKTANRTRTAASSCETTKIHRTCRTVLELLFRPRNQASEARAASATTVHFVRSWETATMMPSPAAIHSASRWRRALSQPPRPGSTVCDDGLAPLGETFHAVPRVEGGVHVGGGGLPLVAREEDDDPEVLWQVERLQHASVARAELRAVGEEERDVGSDLRGDAVQILGRQRLGERLVREPERGRRIGAATAEAGSDRDLLLDLDPPASLDA